MTESEDNASYSPTEFDIIRLESMDIDSAVNGEFGLWRVLRYKNSYVCLIQHKNVNYKEFATVTDLVNYLKKLKPIL